MPEKKRVYYLDVLGAILLFHMMIGHCCQWASCYSAYFRGSYWLSFFMPWFFFKGGMFFKPLPPGEEVRKSARRLLVPFVVFSVVGTFIFWLKLMLLHQFGLYSVLLVGKDLVLKGSVWGNFPLWFLLSLFAVRVIFGRLLNHMASHRGARRLLPVCGGCVLAFAVLLTFYYLDLEDRYVPLYVANISSGLIFFASGYCLRHFRYTIRATVLLSLAYIAVMIFMPTTVDMRETHLGLGWFPLWIPTALLGILAFNGVFKNLFNYKCMLSGIGRDTMSYYCMHWCIIMAVSCVIMSEPGVPDYRFLVVSVVAMIILLPVLTCLIKKSKYSYIIM